MGTEEVLRLTPRFFHALSARYERNVEAQRQFSDNMIAQLIAMVANTGFRGWKEPREPKEFLPIYPSELEGTPRQRKRRESQEKINERLRIQMSTLGALGKMYK